MRRPDVVLVGYLGHFDVHLARLLFRGVPIVLDHLVSASGTGRDRRLDGGPRRALLRMIDAAALAAAAVVLVDTEEHGAALPERYRSRAVVVPVGAPAGWFAAAARAGLEPGGRADGHGPLRVVFYGLYTPLQGTPVIGAALSLITGAPIEVTMIGGGQDAAAARAAAAANAAVRGWAGCPLPSFPRWSLRMMSAWASSAPGTRRCAWCRTKCSRGRRRLRDHHVGHGAATARPRPGRRAGPAR